VLNIRLPKPARRPILFGVPTLLKRLFREQSGAINVQLARTFPGFGMGLLSSQNTNLAAALSGASTTVTLPTTGTFTLATTTGKVRIKIYNGGGTSPTITSIIGSASDGTNTVRFLEVAPATAYALSTTAWYDQMFDYILDTAASGAGGGATGQLSGVVGGATSFSFIIALGGTSPTASADLEIVPLI
jgi:hypothetical protein